MKAKCPLCKRKVGIDREGFFAKHRSGRGRPNKVKDECLASNTKRIGR
jgi:uncharacterized protein YlaI